MMSPASDPDLPADDHLREDISAPSDTKEEAANPFVPGQTNAGQQVGGLAGATQDPDDGETGPQDTANKLI